jgi:gas vesicle protein
LIKEHLIFFTKTAPHIGNQIGSNIQNIGDKVAGVGRQAGNFLETNSAILGDVAGGVAMATGYGAPLGASLISAGNIGQQMGQRLKQGSQEIRDVSNRTGGLIRSQIQNASNQAMMEKNNISNQIKNNVGALNSQVGMAKQQMQQTINYAKNQAISGLIGITDSVEDPFSFH